MRKNALSRPFYSASFWNDSKTRSGCGIKMADAASAVDKNLLAFLNGISKRQYFGEEDITDEFLREDILGGMAEEGTFSADPYSIAESRPPPSRVCSPSEAILFHFKQPSLYKYGF